MTAATMLVVLATLWPHEATAGALRFDRVELADAGRTACVAVATEARFVGFAYNHIVHVFNGCSVTETCAVSTDVNPVPQAIALSSGARAEVLTFMGSPASTFTAEVQCSP